MIYDGSRASLGFPAVADSPVCIQNYSPGLSTETANKFEEALKQINMVTIIKFSPSLRIHPDKESYSFL